VEERGKREKKARAFPTPRRRRKGEGRGGEKPERKGESLYFSRKGKKKREKRTKGRGRR